MLEILFRAKRLDNGEWVEGLPTGTREDGSYYIVTNVYGMDERFGIGNRGEYRLFHDAYRVDPSTVCQYTNIDIRREAWPSSEVHKIFTGDYLGEWGEDEDGNECVCILGVVTYWESEGRYVLADEDGFCNDWTLEDDAKPENWPRLIHCGNIHDKEKEGRDHDTAESAKGL